MLNNGKIKLRALEPEDAVTVFLWENDSSLWQYGNTHAPLSLLQIREYIDAYCGDVFSAKQLRLIIADTQSGEVSGIVDLYDLDPQHRRAGVGIMVDSRKQCRGIGGMALELLAEYAYEELGLHQLWCVTAIDNNPAIRMFERAGFRPCGRLRSWLRIGERYCDALVMQRLLVSGK